MGILLAARIAEVISGSDILTLVDRTVFQPLGMKHSAQGLGRFKLEEMVSCQMDGAAPESGGGDPKAREWDWNSPYWRKLGAPWGGTHASAPDLARFLGEFLGARGKVVKPETARLMIRNHNPKGFTPRGLGFGVGKGSGSPGCSERTFGHTGSTGTLCWADPASETICVVLTSLPRREAQAPPARTRGGARRGGRPPLIPMAATMEDIHMQPNEPTPAQIDLIRKLVRSVTPENAHVEYEKARLQFMSKEEFQAALRCVELEIQQHLVLVEHWHHLASK